MVARANTRSIQAKEHGPTGNRFSTLACSAVLLALALACHCGSTGGSGGDSGSGSGIGATSGVGSASGGNSGTSAGSGSSSNSGASSGSGSTTGASTGATSGAGSSTGSTSGGASDAGGSGSTSGAKVDAGSSGSTSGSKVDAGSSGSTSGAKADAGVVDAGAPSNPSFILGADITFTQQDVAGGATYSDNGTVKSIFQLLKDHGLNYVRMRTFVDPTQSAPNPAGGTFGPYSTAGFGDITHTVAYGKLIKEAGLGFLLDFHYSDTWADPGKQIKPAAWVPDTFAQAVTDLHNYTLADIQALVAGGARPDMVQIGNEITPGMLLTPGTALGPNSTAGWPQLAQLLNAGISAVHQVDPTIKIMLHLDRGGDLASSVFFIKSAIANNVAFDVFGESCYVAFQGGPTACQPTLASLATMFPNLKFAIAEYNTDPADPTCTDTAAEELRKANDIVFNLPNHQGAGAFFWEPTRNVNSDNPGMFTVSGRVYSPIPACINQYDQMKTAYGL